MAKVAFNKEYLFISTLDLNLRKRPIKCYSWSIDIYGDETLILRKVDQKHLDGSETWCWRGMGKSRRNDHAKNKEVLHRVKEQIISY
jgi:hypothetical protein